MKITQGLSECCIKGITNMYDGMFGEYPNPFDAVPFKFNYNGTDGAIGYIGDTIFVMFSGSDSIEDWIQNFKFWRKPVVESVTPKVKFIPFSFDFNIGLNSKIEVEAGFQEHYLYARDYIKQVTANYTKIVVCGHSLGGASATLCAYDLKSHNPEKDITAVMFASPRVGNGKFVKAFNEIVPDAVRWNYLCDIVPKLPPFFFGYQHVASQLEVTTWKEKFEFMLKHPIYAIFGNIADHDLKNYQMIIK